jgi:hypothetical protein
MKNLLGKAKHVISKAYFWQRLVIFLALLFAFGLTTRIESFGITLLFFLAAILSALWLVAQLFRRKNLPVLGKKPMKPWWVRLIAIATIAPLLGMSSLAIGVTAGLAINPFSAQEIAENEARAEAELQREQQRKAAEELRKAEQAKFDADKAAAEKAAAEEQAKRDAARKAAAEEQAKREAAKKAAAEEQAKREAAKKAAADAARKAAAEEQAKREAAKKAAADAAKKAAAGEQAKREAEKKAAAEKAKEESEKTEEPEPADNQVTDQEPTVDWDRINKLQRSAPLLYATEFCGETLKLLDVGIYNFVSASKDGTAIFISTKSGYSVEGNMVYECISDKLNFSNALQANVNTTNALAGTKTWSENRMDFQWTYHPNNGINMSIVREKECFLIFCN